LRQPGWTGEQHPRAKLTDAQADTIHARYHAGGILQRELAVEYGVEQTTISRIIRGKRKKR
jgi:DNA-binding MarR family transcriptional regulator